MLVGIKVQAHINFNLKNSSEPNRAKQKWFQLSNQPFNPSISSTFQPGFVRRASQANSICKQAKLTLRLDLSQLDLVRFANLCAHIKSEVLVRFPYLYSQ